MAEGTELAVAYVQILPTAKGITQNLERTLVGPSSIAGKKAGGVFASGYSKAMTGLGIAAGAAALKSASTFSTAGREVLKLKRLTGESAEEMSRLRYAAQQSGIDTQKLAQSIGLFSKNLAAGKLDDLGLGLKDARGEILPMNAALQKVADKLASMEGGWKKNALVVEIFGRSGRDLLPFLDRGSKGIAELEAEADKMGVTLNDKTLEAVKANIVAGRQFKSQLEGLQISLGQGVLPVLTDVAKAGTSVAHVFASQPAILKQAEIGTLLLGVGYTKLGPPILSAVASSKALFVAQEAQSAAALENAAANNVAAASASRVGGVMSTAALGIAAFAGSYALATAGLNKLVEWDSINADAEGLAASFELLGKKGVVGGELADKYGGHLEKLAKGIKHVQTDSTFEKINYGLTKIKGHEKDIDALDKSLANMVKTGDRAGAQKAYAKISSDLQGLGVRAGDVAVSFGDYAQALEVSNVKAQAAAGPIHKLGDEAVSAADRASKSWKDYQTVLGRTEQPEQAASDFRKMFTGGTDEAGAASSLVAAQHALAQALQDNGSSFDIQTEAGRENREALTAVRDAMLDYTDALIKSGRFSGGEIKAKFNGLAGDLAKIEDQGGLTTDQVDALKQELGLTPDHIDIAFNTPGYDTAIKHFHDVNAALFSSIALAKQAEKERQLLGAYHDLAFVDNPAHYQPPGGYVGATAHGPTTYGTDGGNGPHRSRRGRGGVTNITTNYLGPTDPYTVARNVDRALGRRIR